MRREWIADWAGGATGEADADDREEADAEDEADDAGLELTTGRVPRRTRDEPGRMARVR